MDKEHRVWVQILAIFNIHDNIQQIHRMQVWIWTKRVCVSPATFSTGESEWRTRMGVVPYLSAVFVLLLLLSPLCGCFCVCCVHVYAQPCLASLLAYPGKQYCSSFLVVWDRRTPWVFNSAKFVISRPKNQNSLGLQYTRFGYL